MINLQWKKFPVLDDGFVCLVDVMGDDSSVVQAARVSYGKDRRYYEERLEWIEKNLGRMDYPKWCEGPKDKVLQYPEEYMEQADRMIREERKSDDRKLIRYLMRHRHTTPFEMAEIKLLVRVPMDCWRQWIRHRTANVNEYSTRYTEAIDSQQKTGPDEWRLQAKNNKQGSSGFLEEWPEDRILGEVVDTPSGRFSVTVPPGKILEEQEDMLHNHSREVYQMRLACGVAKEQARKDLPLSTYTEAYWKIDLHNLFHFLSLRMDSHAQKEIRDYATIIGEQIVKPLFPVCWEAFEDYRLNGMFLTRLDIEAIKLHQETNKHRLGSGEIARFPEKLEALIPIRRERDESIAKLKRLELL